MDIIFDETCKKLKNRNKMQKQNSGIIKKYSRCKFSSCKCYSRLTCLANTSCESFRTKTHIVVLLIN